MLFADADPAKARALAEELGGEAMESNVAVADGSDLVVLAVKPNVLDEVAPDLVQAERPYFRSWPERPSRRFTRRCPASTWSA